jgi:hypothetical protein
MLGREVTNKTVDTEDWFKSTIATVVFFSRIRRKTIHHYIKKSTMATVVY